MKGSVTGSSRTFEETRLDCLLDKQISVSFMSILLAFNQPPLVIRKVLRITLREVVKETSEDSRKTTCSLLPTANYSVLFACPARTSILICTELRTLASIWHIRRHTYTPIFAYVDGSWKQSEILQQCLDTNSPVVCESTTCSTRIKILFQFLSS